MPDLSISIVSHRQIQLVQLLLADIQQYCSSISIEIILTVNLEEPLPFRPNDYAFTIRIIHNPYPKGFGENHNAAFALAMGDFFCVLNPDIRLHANIFPVLIEHVRCANVGLVAPKIVNGEGEKEDSAREFPSLWEIVRKGFGGKSAVHAGGVQSVSIPDWVAGMFMLFDSEVYKKIGGFDERYFLYYEDVDLCARLTLTGYQIHMCNTVSAIHDARRSSHKSLRYMRLHLDSVFRFFFSDVYRQLRKRSAN